LPPAGDGKYIYTTDDNKQITLSNVKFVAGKLDLKDLEIEPPEHIKELELSIKAQRETNGLNFTLNKPLKVNLLHNFLDSTARQTVINDVENVGNVLSTKLNNTYTTNHEDYEKEMLLKVCKKAFTDAGGSDAKWKELFPTPEHEDELYTRLQTARAGQPFATTLATANHFNNFNDTGTNKGFKSRYADDKREWNKKQENIKNPTTYRNYLMNTYPTEIENYMKEKFEKVFTAEPAHTFITSAFLRFKDEQEQRGIDNDSHLDLDTRLPRKPDKHRDNYLL
jgi:hypothetical protein